MVSKKAKAVLQKSVQTAKAMSSTTRLLILIALEEAGKGGVRSRDFADDIGLSRIKVAKSLAILQRAELVEQKILQDESGHESWYWITDYGHRQMQGAGLLDSHGK